MLKHNLKTVFPQTIKLPRISDRQNIHYFQHLANHHFLTLHSLLHTKTTDIRRLRLKIITFYMLCSTEKLLDTK